MTAATTADGIGPMVAVPLSDLDRLKAERDEALRMLDQNWVTHQAVVTARNAALEEAEERCEYIRAIHSNPAIKMGAEQCRDAVRALKDKQQQRPTHEDVGTLHSQVDP